MTIQLPTITVILAVRNGATTLQRALDSVIDQTYRPIELVVIDGGSTDGSQAVIERNADHIAYWLSEPDDGIYDAWNKALDHATGDWICFLGADDRYHTRDVFATMAAAMVADEGVHRVIYGSLAMVRPDGSVDRVRAPKWDRRARRNFRFGDMIPHPATFHDRIVFDEHGRFDTSFRIAGDYEFLLRELLDHDPLFVDERVIDMSIGGISDRPSSRFLIQRELYRARYKHGLVKTPPWRSPALARRLFRVWLTNTFGKATAKRVRDTYRSMRRRPKRRVSGDP